MSELFDIVKGNVRAAKKVAEKAKPWLKGVGISAVAAFTPSMFVSCVTPATGGYLTAAPTYQTGFVNTTVHTTQRTANGTVSMTQSYGGNVDAQIARAYAQTRQIDARTDVMISQENRRWVNDTVDNVDQFGRTIDRGVDTYIRWQNRKNR